MNFLQMCQRARSECAIAGTGPADVSGQTGDLERIVNWVADSWREIQIAHPNWRWMRKGFTLTTTADDGTYAYSDAEDDEDSAAISRFSRWLLNNDEDPPKIYLQSAGVAGQRRLSYITWNSFKFIYRAGTQNSGPPAHISVDPDNNIVLGPAPDDTYVVTGDYQRSAQELSANADTPEMPADYHMLVVWMAVEKYGFHEVAEEAIAKAQRFGPPIMRTLELNQLPPWPIADPMA